MGGFNVTDADKYFKVGSHPAAAIWNGVDTSERSAAIQYAKGLLERAKGGDLDQPASNADNTDVREDYALYEQALHVLTHNPYRANGEGTGAVWDLATSAGETSDPIAAMRELALEAIVWMGWNRIEVVRA